MNEEITLTDLFDVEMLQRIQDAFSKMTGLGALITDANGKAVTKGTNFTNFCKKYVRQSPIGCLRCEQCDKRGAELALKSGSSITYYCHAGLVDFAAPIMAGDKMIGCFMGGQVLTEPPDITKIMQVSAEIGVELINFLQSAIEIPIVPRQSVETAADFLYTLTNILSTICYHKYMMTRANIEIEKAANLKSDFLANMSHEIRTPMNAVIGLAEMALREDLPQNAREYITQIKSSGKTLLTIINDILDFSKVESGKMDIVNTEYEPLSVIHDISSIIGTRMDKEDVELIIDINPNIPSKLLGDSVRLKQIITNLSNNAVKFTKSGQVKLVFDYRKLNPETVELLFSVIDTGIGIKKNDLNKLFDAFQQLDSKRNRNVEGTGLGLTITKKLLELMDGDIRVESTYGLGSNFSFNLPQKIISTDTSIKVNKIDITKFYGCIDNKYVAKQLDIDMKRLGFAYKNMTSISEIIESINDDKCYIFIEETHFNSLLQEYVQQHINITAVVLVRFNSTTSYNIPNVIVAKKPLSLLYLAAIFNEEISIFDSQESSDEYFDYTAPDAKILIVDDNSVNLTVCEGLLEPLSMQIDTAVNGQDAIEKISSTQYDLILMDHMMPEIDGVETTHIIRRFHKEYDNIPIIALTANAVSGIKEMFIEEGMNDFIAKPIEVRTLVSKIKQWLPKQKLKNVNAKTIQAAKENREKQSESQSPPNIPELDTVAALKLLGNAKLFWNVLKDYYRSIPKKHALIKQYFEEKDWHNYTVEVHALKSASKQIGALKLSDDALELESAGNALDEATIAEKTPALLDLYAHYEDVLKPFFPEDNTNDDNKETITKKKLTKTFEKLQTALDDLDMDGMEKSKDELSKYKYEGKAADLYKKLCSAIDELDPDACEAIMDTWINML